MTYKPFCRVCERHIGYIAWPKHVGMHKREFLRIMGRDPRDYYNVNWEDVVKYFNPSKAKREPDPEPRKPEPVTLKNFI